LDFEELDAYVTSRIYTIPNQRLTSEAWSLKSDKETKVFEKIMKAGQPLGEYVQKKFFRGVLTGLNEAFELSGPEAKRVLKTHPSSNAFIKPVLGGEDIRRYFVTPQASSGLLFPAVGHATQCEKIASMGQFPKRKRGHGSQRNIKLLRSIFACLKRTAARGRTKENFGGS